MSNQFDSSTKLRESLQKLLTSNEAIHARLYVFGEERKWLIDQCGENEDSISKFVTKLVKREAQAQRKGLNG